MESKLEDLKMKGSGLSLNSGTLSSGLYLSRLRVEFVPSPPTFTLSVSFTPCPSPFLWFGPCAPPGGSHEDI